MVYAFAHGSNEPMPPEQCPDVVFATPSLTHSVSKTYLRSMLQTNWLLKAHGLRSGHMDRDGDQFIAKARNKMFADFLVQFPATQNFFFIDDDVGWPAEKVIEFLQRPDDVICGAYPKKSPDPDFPMSLVVSDNGALIEDQGLLLAKLAPAGFMRIKRHVIERLCAEAPRFIDIESDGREVSFPCVFESGPGPDGWWWGEDYTFCQKWAALGGMIWIDPDIHFTHMGLNTWKGRLSEYLPMLREKAAHKHAQVQGIAA